MEAHGSAWHCTRVAHAACTRTLCTQPAPAPRQRIAAHPSVTHAWGPAPCTHPPPQEGDRYEQQPEGLGEGEDGGEYRGQQEGDEDQGLGESGSRIK